jgi:membrane protease subunit (stomatin/prohibitin family)
LKKAEANAKAEIDRKVENINKRIMDELLKLIEEISARSGTNVFEVTAAGLARKVNNLAETNVMPMLLKLEERKEITVKASRGGSVVVTLLGKRAA